MGDRRPPVLTQPPVPLLPEPTEVLGMQGHLFIHHSTYIPAEHDDLGQLAEFHAEEHDGTLTITHPHQHTPPPPEEEWSWD